MQVVQKYFSQNFLNERSCFDSCSRSGSALDRFDDRILFCTLDESALVEGVHLLVHK